MRSACALRSWHPRGAASGWIPAGHGRFVYPASAPQPRPGVRDDELKGPSGRRFNLRKPGEELLKLLGTWNWKRSEIDAQLLLGWIAAAMIGGALKWRPMAWVTGGAGTGKSTLQHLLDALFGEGGLIDCADTTAAGVYQLLGHRTLPVAIDELEADADNTRVMSVIKLARLAASGGRMMRGGSDHQSVSFEMRSCFFFVDPDPAAAGAGPLAPGDPRAGAIEVRTEDARHGPSRPRGTRPGDPPAPDRAMVSARRNGRVLSRGAFQRGVQRARPGSVRRAVGLRGSGCSTTICPRARSPRRWS